MSIEEALNKIMLNGIEANSSWYYKGNNELVYSNSFEKTFDGKILTFMIEASKKNCSLVKDEYNILMNIIGDLSNNESIKYHYRMLSNRSSVTFNMYDPLRRNDEIEYMARIPGTFEDCNKEFLAEMEEPLIRYASGIDEKKQKRM